ncbi:hypothetical protein B0T10DRAFT_569803 [Thelonectria olida]|uniref:Uncharacterized protein n=1 Tax=Thelonectria olida TaxID=1576542 RepID=A0A9P9AG06_9HYPO|nr:hypothetical protein B0T10DRAFT_569803 [Thelonectria olida]
MAQKVYIEEVLEPYVKKWLDEGRSFVLEEDNDSGYGPSQNNPVRAWKEKHGLNSFFNCPRSPDLSSIENAWSVPAEYIKQFPHPTGGVVVEQTGTTTISWNASGSLLPRFWSNSRAGWILLVRASY